MIDYQTYIQEINIKKSSEIRVGNIALGGDNPIRIQSMTNTNTMDTKATVEQIIRLSDLGCDFVRIATPSIRDAENLYNIKNELLKKNYQIPLIADVHYIPKAAEIAAEIVEKVRINPGNYVDKNKGKVHYTEAEYEEELNKIKERIQNLAEICKKHNTVIRIGTNHGSLSERILGRFGDTPLGMVASAMEFIHIFRSFGFHLLVLSMKASNIKIVVQSTRLLLHQMISENMYYPIHLGVTEAGNGEDGWIKSAGGIGCLLNDGIGDTIRVSLTEDPEKEIPVAQKIASFYDRHKNMPNPGRLFINPFEYNKRETIAVENIGAENPPIVLTKQKDENANYFWINRNAISNRKNENFPVFDSIQNLLSSDKISQKINFLRISSPTIFPELNQIKSLSYPIVLLSCFSEKSIDNERQLFSFLIENQIKNPVVLQKCYASYEELILKGSADFSGLLVDGLGDGIFCEDNSNAGLYILQATGCRISKAEFISCPSCGRTQYNIQGALAEIKNRLNHLKGIKIGVMGCIVNGPGEMADADYGYVGSGKGKITLYKGKKIIRKNIDEKSAVGALISLIKENGDWVDP